MPFTAITKDFGVMIDSITLALVAEPTPFGWRDALNIASVAATVAAAFLAYGAIRQAGKQAKRSQRALQRERRIDFELGVLGQLAEYNEGGYVARAIDRTTTLARMLPVELVPVTRAAVGLPSTPAGESRVAEARPLASESSQSLLEFLRNEIVEELHRAIESRLQERG